MTKITTVGELREALRHSEDEEPLIFDLEEDTFLGRKKSELKCVGVGSSGGGRITVLWLIGSGFPPAKSADPANRR